MYLIKTLKLFSKKTMFLIGKNLAKHGFQAHTAMSRKQSNKKLSLLPHEKLALLQTVV